MARPNVEVVMKIYDAIGRQDTHEIAALCAPDIDVNQSDELPWGGVYRGIAQAIGFFGKLTTFVESGVTVERILDAGDHIAVVGRTAGTVKATDTVFDTPLVHLWEIRDGRITGLAVFLDNITMLPGVVCVLGS